jgi:hypothetical protein
MGPADAGAVGDVADPAVVAADRVGAMVASAALTVSGDVVIVLLGYRRTGQERLYAYVTVAYETVS